MKYQLFPKHDEWEKRASVGDIKGIQDTSTGSNIVVSSCPQLDRIQDWNRSRKALNGPVSRCGFRGFLVPRGLLDQAHRLACFPRVRLPRALAVGGPQGAGRTSRSCGRTRMCCSSECLLDPCLYAWEPCLQHNREQSCRGAARALPPPPAASRETCGAVRATPNHSSPRLLPASPPFQAPEKMAVGPPEPRSFWCLISGLGSRGRDNEEMGAGDPLRPKCVI